MSSNRGRDRSSYGKFSRGNKSRTPTVESLNHLSLNPLDKKHIEFQPTTDYTFATKEVDLEKLLSSDGLITADELKRKRQILEEVKEREALIKQLRLIETGKNTEGSSDLEKKDAIKEKFVAPAKPKKVKNVIKISFEETDEEDHETVNTLGLKMKLKSQSTLNNNLDNRSELLPFKLKRFKRDPTAGDAHITPKKTESDQIGNDQELFIKEQIRIKNEVVTIPFVYYDGVSVFNKVTVRKGDQVSAFLEKARLGKRDFGNKTNDDLMLVHKNVIITQNYEFYYFIVNRIDTKLGRIFDFVSKDSDPNETKVVSRYWYLRNKHIYPATLWREFDPKVDFLKIVEKDRLGRVLFHHTRKN
ncbi:hypothetical protein NADFUDRAFT_51852 [Nadsonia fulvescens var. elongata DSM 6958]|uniref:FAM50A/XAP5 C-terminal domain-containing protein n=1 Tax=Nadsonia fulvescens var. elongata DSM 6958 TaxID=857566 RepID=A0A1E3PK83_9ASCO|nr:hypothetical protein NADFUDRAFT_51852 [Nadsonia fulvescens var. elongata DSM 6958]